MKPREYYENLIEKMPAGAERAVFRVLSHHIGLANAIQKADAIAGCAKLGTHFQDERQFRLIVVKLRKHKIPVCASSGESGYYLAANLEEYREFRGREYVKKIIDMHETVNAMDETIKSMFAAEYAAYQKAKAEKAGQLSLPAVGD